MNKVLYFFLALCIFSSCASRKPIPQTTSNPEQYIRTYAPTAIRNMQQYGIPASITLAQGILESASGNSDLAKKANNHFGIKCTSDWEGKSVRKDDDEKDECFRKYKNVSDSFEDHAKFLQRPRYQKLFSLDKIDYQAWAYGLKEAGYATNPNYPTLLINLIERYNLQEFDKHSTRKKRAKKEKQNKLKPVEKAQNPPVKPSSQNQKTHLVTAGDTLFSIAKKYGVSVEDLMKWNNLSNSTIRVGDELKITAN